MKVNLSREDGSDIFLLMKNWLNCWKVRRIAFIHPKSFSKKMPPWPAVPRKTNLKFCYDFSWCFEIRGDISSFYWVQSKNYWRILQGKHFIKKDPGNGEVIRKWRYISGGYNFPQDGVRAHNAKATLEWMYQRIFHLKCRLQTTQTSTHVAARVFCGGKIQDVEDLKNRLQSIWINFP